MIRILLLTFMPLLLIANSFATPLFKPNVNIIRGPELPINMANYQNHDESETKNEKDPPRIVSFEEQFRKLRIGNQSPVVVIFKLFLTGFGENVKFKSKVDKRFFKMFKRYLAYHGVDVTKESGKHIAGVGIFDLASIYFSYMEGGYNKRTRVDIEEAQVRFVSLLKNAERAVKTAKKSGDRDLEKRARRFIGYMKGMLKELGRLIEHLDK